MNAENANQHTLDELRLCFEEYLEAHFPRLDPRVGVLEDAMRYSTINAGKRLRPLLLLAALQDLGVEHRLGLPFAVALECIHCYSLIHDDLPCMDNDDLRRGKPTNHKAFGEDIAVLAGDGLLSLAFQLCSEPIEKIAPKQQLQAINTLARLAGIEGMVAGQVADMTRQSVEFTHSHKTGALICACVQIAGIVAHLPAERLTALTSFGRVIGKIYQIQDDVLESSQDTATLGKSSSSDQDNNKLTYVSEYGLQGAVEMAQKEFYEAMLPIAQQNIQLPLVLSLIQRLYPLLRND